MLSPEEILSLPYSPEFTEAGVAYLSQIMQDFAGGDWSVERLQALVAAKAVELAFRRLLNERAVPHELADPASINQSNQLDVLLGGRRCRVLGGLISRREDIQAARHTPQLLELDAHAPEEEILQHPLGDEDVLVFGLAAGLVTRGKDDLQLAQSAGEPTFLAHRMPDAWARPKLWNSLGTLAFKSEAEEPIALEVGGQDKGRAFKRNSFEFLPKQRLEGADDFYSLTYLRANSLPSGRVGVHSLVLNDTHIIQPHEWDNLWLYGMRVFLLGYMTRGEFGRQARRAEESRKPVRVDYFWERGLSVPAKELASLPDLFIRAQNWAVGKS